MQYEYIRDSSRAAVVASKLREEKALGYDTETTGLDPHKDKVILASFTTMDKLTYLVDTRDPKNLEPFRPVLEDEKIAKIGVNLTFDYMQTKGSFGIDIEGTWDLMMAEQLIMAGLAKSGYGFADLSKKYLGKEIDKTLQKSFINHTGDFTPAQLEYAATDTRELPVMAQAIKEIIASQGLARVWQIESRAIPAFGDMTFYGQKIDTDSWKQIMADNQKIFDEQVETLGGYFEQVFVRDLFGHLDVNYKSQPQILYGLQMMGVEVDGQVIRDTSKETFKKIQHLPVVMELGKYRKAKRMLEAYGENFLRAINPVTGRIHPEVWQIGTGTGRVAAKSGVRGKTNTLNIPREKRFRHAFITELDRLISTVDFSGAELRIMADKSGDPLMVKGFNSGVDFHCYVAAMLFGREKVEKSDPIRQPTKTLNFGKLMRPSRKKTRSIQGNPEVRAILSQSCRNARRVQRLTAQREPLRTGYAIA